MNIDEAIDKLNNISIYFIWDPKEEKPYFEKYKRKKKVKFNHYGGYLAKERKEYDYEEIIEAAIEIENTEIIGVGRLKTKSFAFQVVNPVNRQAIAFMFESSKTEIGTTYKNVKISIEDSPLIHAMATIKERLTLRMAPLTEYPHVIQLDFNGEKIKKDDCIALIESFLFELEHTYGLEFEVLDFHHPPTSPFDSIDRFPQEKDFRHLKMLAEKVSSNQLPDYNSQAINLFLSAKQTKNEEIRLILLYKVFEYFGPIVLKLETYEALGKRLSDPKVNDPDSAFLASIVELVSKYNKRSSDIGMIREVFRMCIDLEVAADKLPKYLSRTISEKTDWKELRIRIANSLYATRNSIVHAKSNYLSDGNECVEGELQQFNEFLFLVASQVIKWHRRLPKHQK